MAAGSRFPLSLPLGSPSHIEVEDRRDGDGESYAGTSQPNPWQGFASATLAPLILSSSCCNKSTLFFLLSMVAGRNGGGGPLFLGSEVDLLDPCLLRPADLLFKPSIKFCCWYSLTDAVQVGSCGVASAVMWLSSTSDVCVVGIKVASNPIQAMEPFLSSKALKMCSNLELSVVLQEFLYKWKGISWPFPCCSDQLGAATQGMCWTYYVCHGLIVSRWRIKDASHAMDFGIVVFVTLRCLGATMEVGWRLERISTINFSIAVGVHFLFLQTKLGCTPKHVQHFIFSSRCTMFLFADDRPVEDIAPLFGLCHQRRMTTPLSLILRFNSRGSSRLSSVMVLQNLQLGSLSPHMHTPDRPSGEPPAGHQLVWSMLEALWRLWMQQYRVYVVDGRTIVVWFHRQSSISSTCVCIILMLFCAFRHLFYLLGDLSPCKVVS